MRLAALALWRARHRRCGCCRQCRLRCYCHCQCYCQWYCHRFCHAAPPLPRCHRPRQPAAAPAAAALAAAAAAPGRARAWLSAAFPGPRRLRRRHLCPSPAAHGEGTGDVAEPYEVAWWRGSRVAGGQGGGVAAWQGGGAVRVGGGAHVWCGTVVQQPESGGWGWQCHGEEGGSAWGECHGTAPHTASCPSLAHAGSAHPCPCPPDLPNTRASSVTLSHASHRPLSHSPTPPEFPGTRNQHPCHLRSPPPIPAGGSARLATHLQLCATPSGARVVGAVRVKRDAGFGRRHFLRARLRLRAASAAALTLGRRQGSIRQQVCQ